MIKTIILITLCTFSVGAQAVIPIQASAGAGVMIQPSSQYFHSIYGGTLTLEIIPDVFFAKGLVWQRPIFNTETFRDQDNGHHASIGYRLKHDKNLSCDIFWGVGEIYGWIERTADKSRNSYDVYGSNSSVNLNYKIKSINISLEHVLFIGRRSQLEIDAKVLWPFSVTWLQIGLLI